MSHQENKNAPLHVATCTKKQTKEIAAIKEALMPVVLEFLDAYALSLVLSKDAAMEMVARYVEESEPGQTRAMLAAQIREGRWDVKP